jgi:signal transduction histidine kinase
MKDEILQKLSERVKELTALHTTARILQDETKSPNEIINDIVLLLPPAWQYPEITCARIRFMQYEASTPNLIETEWQQAAPFMTHGGQRGSIEIYYLEEKPVEHEGPFLREERELIESLAEMLRAFFQHLLYDEALQAAHDDLERQVKARTADIQKANEALKTQISDYLNAQKKIDIYQGQLRQLAAELSLAEARERRAIAGDLHDHIGQSLAFIKMNISQFRGNAVFCGFESKIDEIMELLNQTIRYIRDMTFEISPPVLYELGLEAALDWMRDRYQRKHNLCILIHQISPVGKLTDDVSVTLFKSVQELLNNAIKHSGADQLDIYIDGTPQHVEIKITDNGCGFDSSILDDKSARDDKFGLFNLKVRLSYLGGNAHINSIPGKGTTVTLTIPRQAKKA